MGPAIHAMDVGKQGSTPGVAYPQAARNTLGGRKFSRDQPTERENKLIEEKTNYRFSNISIETKLM